ncbi:MAG TPA: alpha-glucosidase/alpha-galactosidase [Dehalococcoidia bacterium]|nr:alpha-glucosidase/alpha-galactosidase [Dehalococcoidia bacterium]
MTKIVAIGVGSLVFGVELLRDVYQTPELRGAELWLVDLDPDALRRMGGLAAALNGASGWDVTLRTTTERVEALPGADFVVTSIARDRDRTWETDHRLALMHGFPSVLSENGGPGGLSHTLRSIPPVLEIARDIDRLAPDALLLNYTNPENRVCLAVHRYTNVRSIGLCHGVAETVEWVAQVLEMPRDDIDLRAAGTNHFTWTTSLTERPSGRDLLPTLRERLGDDPPEKWRLCTMLYDTFGVFPTTGDNHVGEYIGWAAELLGTEGYDFAAYARNRGLAHRNHDAWAAGTKSVASLLARPSREARLGHSSVEIMAALISGRTTRRPSFIIPNDGYIENVARDAVVEVPGMISDGTFRGIEVGRLAGPVASMVQREIAIEELAVEAAVTGSRSKALEALLIDPCVHSAKAAGAFLDDVLEAHRAYLPAFWE